MLQDVKTILQIALERKATDIHLVTGRPPILRVEGELTPVDGGALTHEIIKGIIYGLLDDRQKVALETHKDLDFSYFELTGAMLRVNAHYEKGRLAATLRIIPFALRLEKDLNLPPIVAQLAAKRKGLIIFAGSSGSGKTTSMTYLIDRINSNYKRKIVTIEDPIEYIHQSKQSLIIQREVGNDTESFSSALKYALRQDPDVVMVGEMRDLESISMALTTAETGHLVMTTVHSPNALETVNRIIDVHPADKRDQIYVQLAENLLAVVAQMLVPRQDGKGRILATEVLYGTMPVRNMIRRGALIEIRGQMDTEQQSESHTYEKCLSDLYKKGIISMETAKEYATSPHMLKF